MIRSVGMPCCQTLPIHIAAFGMVLASCWVEKTACLAAGQTVIEPRAVGRIPAGTLVAEHRGAGWNRVVLLARPRLASGDVDQIPRFAHRYATMFYLTIMARVTSEKKGESGQYKLAELGVGYSLPKGGQYVVVSSDTPTPRGLELGFLERRVLAASEQCLEEVVLVGHHDTLRIFDAKAIVLQRGAHQDRVVRHAVWVDPTDGQIATLVWLLAASPSQGYRMAEDVMQLLPARFFEDRQFNVKASQFRFGIPSARAFALVRLPQGQPIGVTAQLATLATARYYTAASLHALAVELATALQAVPGGPAGLSVAW